ncbi:UDP-N-acetylenolpyruvoylglucosamine reductase [candidate division WOR-1 bacterium RIFOXYA12_FULL_52_29]|uniref:UDP-N-acetylenolpyruvoylglucosamine reductase n=1 Tax=candidate division WOR-1 bacterium RIFOXYC12_FULL_54_18 TaxID=1802584 RepID=A0A1F4T5C0_UNCSA|nr:MAG: UDP-N-acetylenolpyruvoylglucosamine reductase [candidate division WOR-1 bacterium RIFOXYA2_FULL_51_19]OGC17349.1 MAG: UDP-N-acetylenolpyruvoylglucosamine reductase [candidate division WOR-1 bacterium RIFOXYA12_FULL_52_29]OGC26208.1 MAG: UDP-N-acetylenolpyruvoylglucosamine reductase [candidate division WOR-1 bacterium RIFOXYB2_FULL_45_9]OGC27766.1 MAG: UDP-N-acetylenolpyruvoylglucosamine reductase [candidate division WOR-1 bacterium RIFOXYC12_FULL_54_18]OGC29944.1 MAG: UDP-N-acetylenolpy
MKYLKDEPLKKHTSFRIGGPARYFCVPKNQEELAEAIQYAREKKLKFAILGAGTNVLALDKGYRGLVIKLANGLKRIYFKDNLLYAEAGVYLPQLVQVALKRRLTGLEFLAGIPGTVGGAIVMNAGAWGKEISGSIDHVKALDKNGQEVVLTRKELGFGYRKSSIEKKGLIVVETAFKLKTGQVKAMREKINEHLAQRKLKQPLGIPNAGSVFKNQQKKIAGKLLQESGAKGLRCGDAQISEKHANFIVNLGEASSRDVLKLMTKAQKIVKEKYKVNLEPEIKIMVE